MNIFIDELEPPTEAATQTRFALYIDGDFQFDTADEKVYHESLALPALSLLHAHKPGPKRVLICGGGDGLALRECLRFPNVAHVDLVDYSPEMLELAATQFAAINQHALEDTRTHIHICDAWDFLNGTLPYDLIVCDFTVPRKHEDTRVFSTEWFEALSACLNPGGIIAANTVSPQTTPEAFWCLMNTLRAANLKALPYRVCIPSFRDHGYGAWGFVIASRDKRFTTLDLKRISCPVATEQADLSRLWRGAHFTRAERALAHTAPTNTIDGGELLPLLLNPGLAGIEAGGLPDLDTPYDLNPLFNAIPIAHPYHTRAMIETLAEQVAGSVRDLDIPRLIDAVIKRSSRLSSRIVDELRKLKEFMQERVLHFELFSAWSYRLFAALVILMTLANAISPDNAFAKGSFSGGAHGGFSVSHSTGMHSSSSFGKGSFGAESGSPGGSFAGRSSTSSFGGQRGSAISPSRSFSSFSSSRSNVLSSPVSPHFTGTGFRTSYGRGTAVDINGSYERARVYNYWGGSYGHPYTQVYGGQRQPAQQQQPQPHEALFLASDDMSVLDNGDVVVNVSESVYILLTNGTAALMSAGSPDPIVMLYPDPELFANVRDQLAQQQSSVVAAASVRRDWLAWSGWTASFLPTVRSDRDELRNLTDLIHRLDLAQQRLGTPPAGNANPGLKPGETELFIGCVIRQDGTIALHEPDGRWLSTDLVTIKHNTDTHPCPPVLATAVRSALDRVLRDIKSGIKADTADLQQLRMDASELNSDMNQYVSIRDMYGDSSYEVDYGTDEIPVSEAIFKTRQNLNQTETETRATEADIEKLTTQQAVLDAAVARYR